jgi:hypothetical protein
MESIKIRFKYFLKNITTLIHDINFTYHNMYTCNHFISMSAPDEHTVFFCILNNNVHIQVKFE